MDNLEKIFADAGDSEPVQLIREWAKNRQRQIDEDEAWAKKMKEYFADGSRRKSLGNFV